MSPEEDKTPDDKTPAEIEAEIEATREQLGDSVAEIADRANLKKQAGKKAGDMKDQASAKAEELKQVATSKLDEVKRKAASADSDRYGGSGGDIGGGPTGDVRQSPEIVGGRERFLVIAAAFVAGLALGRIMYR